MLLFRMKMTLREVEKLIEAARVLPIVVEDDILHLRREAERAMLWRNTAQKAINETSEDLGKLREIASSLISMEEKMYRDIAKTRLQRCQLRRDRIAEGCVPSLSEVSLLSVWTPKPDTDAQRPAETEDSSSSKKETPFDKCAIVLEIVGQFRPVRSVRK